ncbi:hypothetical protein AHAS_Ahas05G0043500 [Arachis hypogaea]
MHLYEDIRQGQGPQQRMKDFNGNSSNIAHTGMKIYETPMSKHVWPEGVKSPWMHHQWSALA